MTLTTQSLHLSGIAAYPLEMAAEYAPSKSGGISPWASKNSVKRASKPEGSSRQHAWPVPASTL